MLIWGRRLVMQWLPSPGRAAESGHSAGIDLTIETEGLDTADDSKRDAFGVTSCDTNLSSLDSGKSSPSLSSPERGAFARAGCKHTYTVFTQHKL